MVNQESHLESEIPLVDESKVWFLHFPEFSLESPMMLNLHATYLLQ
jgi:hypothetical protein